MKPYFSNDRDEIWISRDSSVPSVDALAKHWAQFHQATVSERLTRPLTFEDIAMDTQPQQWSDRMDYEEKLTNPRNWDKHVCYRVTRAGSPHFEQALAAYHANELVVYR